MRFLSLLLALFLVSNVLAEDKYEIPQREARARKATKSIKLDGRLTEDVWKDEPLTEFTQKYPNEGEKPTEKTEAWISYDESNLYVAAKLYDSNPQQIDASLARRDSWIESDWFHFYVDSYFDKKTGYFFSVNPGGSIMDGTYYNNSWNSDSWDGIWESEARVTDYGWCVEMKIPFSQLRYRESDDMTWGINFKREIKRKNESDYYVMVPNNESGFVSHFAKLKGISNINGGERVEISPYLVQKAQYLKHDVNNPFYAGNQYKTSIGADFKLGLGGNYTIDATINPDFGQVEVDPAVVNLSAFETYYQEKRPFFVDNTSVFNFGNGGATSNWGFNFGNPSLIYPRRIGRSPQGNLPGDYDYAQKPGATRILGAAKLTGKIDESWSVGGVSAVTERTYAQIEYNDVEREVEVEPATHYGAFRTQKEFNSGKQALGMIFTSVNRDLSDANLNEQLNGQAYTAGVDGWTFLDDDEVYVISGYAVGSYTSGSPESITRLQKRPYRYYQRPDAGHISLDTNRTSLSGYYTRVMLNKQKGNFYINSALGAVSPGFENNDLGFQWMADKLNGHLVLGYRWYKEDDIFRRKYVYASHFRSYDYEGNTLSNGIWGRFTGEFHNYYGFHLTGVYSFEHYSNSYTRGGPLTKNPENYSINFTGYSDSRKDLIARTNLSYAPDGLDTYWLSAGIEFEWLASPRLSISIEPEYRYEYEKRQWVGSFEDDLAVHTFGERYVYGRMFKIQYQQISV